MYQSKKMVSHNFFILLNPCIGARSQSKTLFFLKQQKNIPDIDSEK